MGTPLSLGMIDHAQLLHWTLKWQSKDLKRAHDIKPLVGTLKRRQKAHDWCFQISCNNEPDLARGKKRKSICTLYKCPCSFSKADSTSQFLFAVRVSADCFPKQLALCQYATLIALPPLEPLSYELAAWWLRSNVRCFNGVNCECHPSQSSGALFKPSESCNPYCKQL